MTKVHKSQTEVIKEATKEGKSVHFCNAVGLMSPQALGVGAEVPKIQRARCAPDSCGEGRLSFLRCIHGTGFTVPKRSRLRMDGRKRPSGMYLCAPANGLFFPCTWMTSKGKEKAKSGTHVARLMKHVSSWEVHDFS